MKKNHKNPHKTPEGYFNSFNERLMDKIAKEESNIPKNDGFSVPEAYFDTFNSTVSDKVKPKVVQLHSYRKYYYAVASVAAIVLMVVFFNQNSNQAKFDFEDLASNEIDAYFDKTDLEFSSYELAEVINLDNVSLLDITDANNTEEGDLILDYLNETTDEIEDLNLDYDEFE
ncbi:hypothetical protein ACFSQJ_08325 [Croceitalea marina]|uniref:Uncharacterized protein n=1 Tax=Croceitalea marina TaxID=1775166 RepID=A0ABW5MW20_9FLAO